MSTWEFPAIVEDYDEEMKKVMAAVHMGAEAIMDLSSHGDTAALPPKTDIRVPCYHRDCARYMMLSFIINATWPPVSAKDFIDVIRLHAEDGVDFVTLHCGITRKTIDQIRNHKRKMNIVSRGGSLVFAWMSMTGRGKSFL